LQEQFIQAKLETGKYRTAQEILEFAFRLLDEYEQADFDSLEGSDRGISLSLS
jgi:antitoxin ParD1/3/4